MMIPSERYRNLFESLKEHQIEQSSTRLGDLTLYGPNSFFRRFSGHNLI